MSRTPIQFLFWFYCPIMFHLMETRVLTFSNNIYQNYQKKELIVQTKTDNVWW